jgi:hypothetical protein
MAIFSMVSNAWTSLGALLVDTTIQAIDGDIWVFSGDTTGQAKENGFLLRENEIVSIAAGVLVSGYAEPATRKRTPSLHTLSVSVGGL